jgi:flagellar basal body-associated protein FliL
MISSVDSKTIITLFLMIVVLIVIVTGIISSARLVRSLEDEEDNKNRS